MYRFFGSFVVLLALATATQASFTVTNLVTDDQSANTAQLTDSTLKNAWGISSRTSSPFWVSANGSGVSNLYRVNPVTNAPTKLGLSVTIPGEGNVTGQVFNSNSSAFNGDAFLFVSEDGTISGWRNALGTTAENLQLPSTDNVYKGTTEATIGGDTYLYSANFKAGTIDVLKGTAAAPNLSGNFTDPNLPAGYAPFNIQNLGGKLYVTYALQDADKKDDAPGAGHGFVDVFDTQGNFLGRVASQGTLNSPWGLAIAPASFLNFANDLLVGNFGDGRINAFNPTTFAFLGQLTGPDGPPLAIDGLWALRPGNNGNAGNSDAIYFSAGPDEESHGLFGVITAVPEPAALAVFAQVMAGLGFAFLTRRKRGAV